MGKSVQLTAWVCVIACVCATPAAAEPPWPVLQVESKQVRVDGELGEWRNASFVRVGDDDRGRAEVALAHDGQGLYLAARVFDDVLVRSAKPSPREDAVRLQLELPRPNGPARYDVWLYAGRVGETRAVAEVRGEASEGRSAATGIRVIEGPGADRASYVLEAFCPWSSFSGAENWAFAHGTVVLHDVDGVGRAGRDVARDPQTTKQPPWLSFEVGQLAAWKGFVSQHALDSAAPALDALCDVRDDARLERVVVAGAYVVVLDATGRFDYATLPVVRAADVHSAELMDLTGDGKSELVVRYLQRTAAVSHELWKVFALGPVGAVRPLWGVELRRELSAGYASAALSVAKAPAPSIVLRSAEVRGLSEASVLGDDVPEVVAIPWPWGSWLERTYAWDGHGFSVQRERARATAHASAAQIPVAPAPAAPSDVPAAAVSGGTAALIQAYRAARGVSPQLRARFAQQANVAEDARPEQLLLFDRECLIVGEGFRSGSDYFYFSLPVETSEQVLALFTGDVTGDHRAEIIARVRTQLEHVTRELLLVYSFHNGSFAAVLTAEIGRSDAGHAITNEARLVPQHGRTMLEIQPGSAAGWTRESYPFASQEQPGIAALLLPWADRARRYCYDGRRLAVCLGSD